MKRQDTLNLKLICSNGGTSHILDLNRQIFRPIRLFLRKKVKILNRSIYMLVYIVNEKYS